MKQILSTLLLSVTLGSYAQTYTFSHATNTYADLTNPSLLTPIDEVWDDPEYTINFPFPFQYFGTNVAQFYGGEGLGADLWGSTSSISSILIPVLCDIIDLGYINEDPQSSISYQIEGASGNRILKVQWKNVGFYEDVTENEIPTDFMNFQVWFYEGSHRIEIRFGSSNISDPFEVFGNPGPGIMLIRSINLNTNVITPSYYLSGNPSNPTMTLTTDINQLLNSHLDAMPANGRTYIFTPSTDPVSIENAALPEPLSIYPNPALNEFNIANASNMEIQNIDILDVSGRVVKSFTNITTSLTISDLNSGQYFVKITTAQGVTTTSLTKM